MGRASARGLSAVVTRLQVFDVPHAVMSVPARLRLGVAALAMPASPRAAPPMMPAETIGNAM